jgi:hypothetical protein
MGLGKILECMTFKETVSKGILTAEHAKDCAKHAKIKHWYYVLCELYEKPSRPLRLMDFDF